jgi:signal transduction histidine kinase
VTAIKDALHELDLARQGLRKSSDEISKAFDDLGNIHDTQRLKHFGLELVDQLDTIDLIFELLRIELNPEGIAVAPKDSINIYGIFHRAFLHNSRRMKKKRITWSITRKNPEGLIITAYPSLGIVPMVLIDNAVKYAPNGSHLAVYINAEDKMASIESPGPKIRDDEIHRIFEEGFRGHYAQTAQGAGQGRGLYIAKNILDAHGFAISVSQKPTNAIGGIPYAYITFEVVFDGLEGGAHI